VARADGDDGGAMRSDLLPGEGDRGRGAGTPRLELRRWRLRPAVVEAEVARSFDLTFQRLLRAEGASASGERTEPRAAKRRILHVVPGLGHGGAEHQLLMNVEKLDGSRFESHVVHLYPRTQLAPLIEAAGARVHSVACSGPFGTAQRIFKLARLIRRLDVDLVHTSNVDGELHGGIAGRMTGVPVVGTLTNIAGEQIRLVDNPYLNGRKLRWARRLRRFLLRRTHDRYIAISHCVAQSTIRQVGLPPAAVEVIYRGMPEDGLGAEADHVEAVRRELDTEHRYPVLLTVGRLVPQKGQRYLIEAMPEVLRAHPRAQLLIVGMGFLEERLRAQVDALGLQSSVRFLGRREDVPALMGAADIFVFPSLFEGLGVSLLEACASGLPCVVSNVGPLPEVIEDGATGVLVPPQEPRCLADAIIRLACDRELMRRYGEAARARVRRTFQIDRSIAQLEELYERVLHRRTGEAALSR
jgi:glycosyltransferase involved in cell wall biosynthesis